MEFISYILTRSLIWLLHLLPEQMLYFFSDCLYVINYYLVGYRKKVVFDNISNAFPDYSQQEVRRTAKRFYHHLCDLILESAISHFYSESRAMKRIKYTNPELLDDIYRKGKQVMAVTAHYGNWEYLSTMGLTTKYTIIGIYKPLKNKYFDRMVQKNRQRFGAVTVSMNGVARKLITFQRENRPALTLFLSDQRPVWEHIQYWTKFMGLDTPLYLGTEKLARKLDAAVVFLKIRKVRRGRYEVDIELICEDPNNLEPFEITEAHVKILENLIREAPEYWLWSHRRWKHSYERFLEERGAI
ncbi:MAG: lysophospholipid acyltransferase family protein [Bacteroidales bacterium]|nr:lysophospholipid acyltransferase family protein [Bacteroidales bacterium]